MQIIQVSLHLCIFNRIDHPNVDHVAFRIFYFSFGTDLARFGRDLVWNPVVFVSVSKDYTPHFNISHDI